MASRAPRSCSSARPPVGTKIELAGHSWGEPGNCWIAMPTAVGLDRRQVYIANIVPLAPSWDPPLTLQETQTCLPFITRTDRARPTRSSWSASGLPSAQTLLGVKTGITARARLVVHLPARERAHDSPPWRCFTRLTCCASPRRSGLPGPICRLLRRLSTIYGREPQVKPPQLRCAARSDPSRN